MTMTLLNSINGINELADEALTGSKARRLTSRMGKIGSSPTRCKAPVTFCRSPYLRCCQWWGEKFNRLYNNAVKIPELKTLR